MPETLMLCCVFSMRISCQNSFTNEVHHSFEIIRVKVRGKMKKESLFPGGRERIEKRDYHPYPRLVELKRRFFSHFTPYFDSHDFEEVVREF